MEGSADRDLGRGHAPSRAINRSAPLRLSAQTIVRLSPFAALYVACLLLLAGHWSAEPVIDAVAAELGADLRLCRSAAVGSIQAPTRVVPNALRPLGAERLIARDGA